MALRQAESEVRGRSKEGAKVVVGEFGGFSADKIKEVDDTMENDLSTISGPEPGVSVPATVNEAGKRNQQF